MELADCASLTFSSAGAKRTLPLLCAAGRGSLLTALAVGASGGSFRESPAVKGPLCNADSDLLVR